MDWYKIGVVSFFVLFLMWAMIHATKQSKKYGRRK
jgi:hypothetical protein